MATKRPLSEVQGTDDSDRPLTKRRSEVDPESLAPSETLHKLSYPPTTTPTASKPIPFQQPSTLLTFSYTPDRVLEFNNSAMKHYVDPPQGAELSYGYDRWIKRPDEKGRIDHLLKAWVKVRGGGSGGGIGVVLWRGVMTKILIAPYEDREGWDLNVMCINGTMFFEEHLWDERLKEKNDMAPRQRTQTYYGYAFESWCTSSNPKRPEALPGHRRGWGGDVDTNVQWCNVIKTKLGDTRMVIGGEVDCVRGDYNGRNDNLVELKTSMSIRGPQDEARFEKKLLKFYFQSFLLGVPEIVVGFRTPNGKLTTIQSFKTLHLPRLVRGKPGAWDPSICLDWGDRFLSFLKGHVGQKETAGPEPKVWRVRFVPGVGVSASLLDEEGVKEVEGGEDRVGFLPKWYWDEEVGKEDKVLPEVSAASETSGGTGDGEEASTTVPSGWQI
ncbi:hypothetical protein JAAARDRAFT_137557 [Jaapia argillacea MUCL 33604]|uniref:Decapping nuclease n=1 Tax=Jaapia argillacea MUCL 33604 TaxID=933084 RepID=A0A067PS57_9AGAM|nr:hypothetical protein JAAARDRAFT_137557 [Jaapia argillacea MUCL 33604]